MFSEKFHLDNYLDKHNKTAILIAVVGFSGVGKTHLTNLILSAVKDNIAHIRVDAYFKGDNYIYCDPQSRKDCQNPNDWDSPKNFAKREFLLTLKHITQQYQKIYTRNISDKDILKGYYLSRPRILTPKDVYLFEGVNLFRLDIKHLKMINLIFLVETSLATQIINRISRTTIESRLLQLEAIIGGYRKKHGVLYQQINLGKQRDILRQNLKVITIDNDYLETAKALTTRNLILSDNSRISIIVTRKYTINLIKQDKNSHKTNLVPLYSKNTKHNYDKSLFLLNQLVKV